MGRQYRNTKENIFGETVKLFSEQGYNATTMRQIASAAGVNEATIYIYFDNKEALMDEILLFSILPNLTICNNSLFVYQKYSHLLIAHD